jgi:cytochrome c biogenesis factor
VVVHASIILLMLGAWISRHYGYEGQLRVYEGQGSSDLHLYDKEILFTGINSDPTSNGRADLPPKKWTHELV